MIILQALDVGDKKRYINALCFDQLRCKCPIRPVLKVAALIHSMLPREYTLTWMHFVKSKLNIDPKWLAQINLCLVSELTSLRERFQSDIIDLKLDR